MKTWYIGFYKYSDSKYWNRTNIFETEEEVKTYLDKFDYIDTNTITIREIQLPNI